MLTNAQDKLIRSLHKKKGRQKHQKCLVEGEKNIAAAGELVEFTFDDTTARFKELITTTQPQSIAAVANVPNWKESVISDSATILLLDYVQDPGNVGAIFRLAQGFNATVVLVESADPTNSKVIRSSAGAMFSVPWITIPRDTAVEWCNALPHDIYKLEKRDNSVSLDSWTEPANTLLVIGSEGNGIQLDITGTSIVVEHASTLESLNVGHATAIAPHSRYVK